MASDAELAAAVGRALTRHGYTLVTAESCTGGGIAKLLTDIAGCSAWFERGFIAYSDAAKQEQLGLSARTLEAHGAVSDATVREMAHGALKNSQAQVALACSGIAGPGGGSPEKPVGTVWFAWLSPKAQISARQQFSGDREAIRGQTVRAALTGLLDALGDNPS